MNIIHRVTCGLLILTATLQSTCNFDATYIGFYKFADGIGKRAIGQIQTLKDALKINFVNTYPVIAIADDIAEPVLKILRHPDKTPGTVMVFVDTLYGFDKKRFSKQISQCKIKLAYVTIESTKAPVKWVNTLNDHFDGVLVPDPFCLQALKESGVTKPIFVLPEVCYLEEFLNEPLQEKPHTPFSFGVSATSLVYKNNDLLLEAFAAEFKNSPDVVLRIHNHNAAKSSRITNKIKELDLTNVIATHGPIKKEEYIAHMKNIDCYTLLSKGEGFSATPREALALGRPCILANHTAHRTICDTGYVRAIEAPLVEKHDSENYEGDDVGNVFNCELSEVRKALRDVYEHYALYVTKALMGREWVKQYTGEQLKPRFISMLKPRKVIFGDKNEVTSDYLMIDSPELYEKYMTYIIAPNEAGQKSENKELS